MKNCGVRSRRVQPFARTSTLRHRGNQSGKVIGRSLAVGPGGVILARGPYGEHAESMVVVEVEPRPPIGRGTRIAEALESRGYRGP